MKLFVTGGAGFIGSNFIKFWMKKYKEDKILNFDKLTYAANINNLDDIKENTNYSFVKGDIVDFEKVKKTLSEFKPDIIVNFAAESHNSYAILNPTIFFKTNVIGTQTLLEAARVLKIKRFHHISTCEVYGDLELDSKDSFFENSPYKPRTPYNASKAAADLAVRAYYLTYNLPITISNCSNNYGPYQFPEKLIPLFVTNLLEDKEIPLYKSSQNKREWLYVDDHCRAIELILKNGKIGETYNIGSYIEKSVEEITDIILNQLKKSDNLKKYVDDRPSHDRRYLLNSEKIREELNWKPQIDFNDGMKFTINWYKENISWWKPLIERLKIKEDSWK